MDHVGESDSLWLTREPEYDEIIADFANFDVASFDELVFCGFGEPTERIDVLLKVARYFKETYHKPIRINTNGLGNLVNGRDIAPDFKGLIDTISISLNLSLIHISIVAHEFLGSSVEGKDVFIVDDMISSGESMLDVAKELKLSLIHI